MLLVSLQHILRGEWQSLLIQNWIRTISSSTYDCVNYFEAELLWQCCWGDADCTCCTGLPHLFDPPNFFYTVNSMKIQQQNKKTKQKDKPILFVCVFFKPVHDWSPLSSLFALHYTYSVNFTCAVECSTVLVAQLLILKNWALRIISHSLFNHSQHLLSVKNFNTRICRFFLNYRLA